MWATARILGGAAVLAALVARLGAGPFLEGLRTVDVRVLVAGSGIAVATTVCSAWRWRLVARGLGVELRLGAAVAAYYRSQFLNTVLPGGVLGDVHRGVRHGRDAGDVGRGLRAVAWERTAGQVVQIGLAAVVLLAVPSPLHAHAPSFLLPSLAVLAAVVVLGRVLPRRGPSRAARVVRTVGADLRQGVLGRAVWPGVLASSVAVVAGHTATLLVAARAAGATASVVDLLPVALLVLVATAVPLNVGGWGPREGAAAWLFAVAGLGAGLGVAAAVAYGVLVLVATLPGAAVLAVDLRRGRRSAAEVSHG
jgi:uncharacterized membrane protein YbhN (UPF0104 family)